MSDVNMLQLITDAPIVSSDTLRPDHLCAHLIDEADRLGVELDRDLWQPAVAIAAHGLRGVCLDLPPRLADISSDIVSELFDALNWAAPSGCHLAASEGDGALFIWHVSLEGQAESINSDPKSRFEAKTLEVPSHWLSAIVNGDESSFDYYDDAADYKAYQAFCKEELSDGWYVSSCDDESDFNPWHDARPYGVLPCDAVTCLAMRPKLTTTEAIK
jgi:hypothetical protein